MTFIPKVNLDKSGDTLTITVEQKYMARGVKKAYRWVIAGQFSLKELRRKEKEHLIK